MNPFGDLQDLESLADPSSVAAPVENPTNDPQTQAKKAPTNLTTTNSKVRMHLFNPESFQPNPFKTSPQLLAVKQEA